MKKLKIGIVGCGKWGWRYAPAFLRTGLAEITHIYRTNKESLGHVKEYFPNVKIENDYDKLLDECDAIVISTPPQVREELCLRAIEKFKPIIAEKPLALSSAACKRIQEASSKYGIPVLVSHLHTFSGAFETLQAYCGLSASYPIHIHSKAGNDGPYRNFSPLWDWAPHDLSMILALGFGMLDEINVNTATKFGDNKSARHRFDLIFSNTNSLATVEVWNNSGPKTRQFEIHNSDGSVFGIYDDLAIPKVIVNVPVDYDTTPPLDKLVSIFTRVCLFGIRDPRIGVRDSVRIAEILEMVESIQR